MFIFHDYLFSLFSTFLLLSFFFFFFNDPATTEIYTLSLHDALPIFGHLAFCVSDPKAFADFYTRVLGFRLSDWIEDWFVFLRCGPDPVREAEAERSEEHTSELQSRSDLVCRLLLEKKKSKPHRTSSRKKGNRKAARQADWRPRAHIAVGGVRCICTNTTVAAVHRVRASGDRATVMS